MGWGKRITEGALEGRKAALKAKGFPVSKWIIFAERMLARGFEVRVHAARSTRSKYVYVIRDDRRFKVRFSNHPPNRHVESRKDSDFYVGVSNTRTTTTFDAIRAVEEFFGETVSDYGVDWITDYGSHHESVQ